MEMYNNIEGDFMDDSRKILHFRYNLVYAIGFLLIVIIVLLTTKWGAIPELAALFSFGLTLTSIFLSLIAIVFTIISNFSSNQSVIKLHEASSSINQSTVIVTETISRIEDKIKCMPSLLGNVDVVIKKQEQIMEAIDKNGMEKTLSKRESAEERGNGHTDAIRRFLGLTSFTGLLATYVCDKSKEGTKPFKLKDAVGEENYRYAHGFIVALTSVGYLEYNQLEDMMIVTSIDSGISKGLKNAIENKIKDLAGDNPDSQNFEKELKSEIERADKYFSS